jgi:hypothetical protein
MTDHGDMFSPGSHGDIFSPGSFTNELWTSDDYDVITTQPYHQGNPVNNYLMIIRESDEDLKAETTSTDYDVMVGDVNGRLTSIDQTKVTDEDYTLYDSVQSDTIEGTSNGSVPNGAVDGTSRSSVPSGAVYGTKYGSVPNGTVDSLSHSGVSNGTMHGVSNDTIDSKTCGYVPNGIDDSVQDVTNDGTKHGSVLKGTVDGLSHSGVPDGTVIGANDTIDGKTQASVQNEMVDSAQDDTKDVTSHSSIHKCTLAANVPGPTSVEGDYGRGRMKGEEYNVNDGDPTLNSKLVQDEQDIRDAWTDGEACNPGFEDDSTVF